MVRHGAKQNVTFTSDMCKILLPQKLLFPCWMCSNTILCAQTQKKAGDDLLMSSVSHTKLI
jgi:hypothetical protein